MAQQVRLITDELTLLKAEIVNVKASHAGLHQTTVESGSQTSRTLESINAKVQKLEDQLPSMAGAGAGKRLSLIEPKQMTVDEFAGGVTDARNKFIEWSEKVRDRVQLFDPGLAEEMKRIERTSTIITKQMSEDKGVTAQSNRELQAFLKDKTSGIAGAIVRGNKDAIGLETWRLLWAEFSPQTLTSTMRSQQLEKFPKPAKNMSEMSKRLLDWERDLRRCSEEGRSLPSEEEKRLALLRLLPGPQRKAPAIPKLHLPVE